MAWSWEGGKASQHLAVFSVMAGHLRRILAKKTRYWSHAWQERLSDLQKIKLRDILVQQLTVPKGLAVGCQPPEDTHVVSSRAEPWAAQKQQATKLIGSQSWKPTFASCHTPISFCKQLLEHDLLFASHDRDYKAGFFWYWAVHLRTKPPIKLFA